MSKNTTYYFNTGVRHESGATLYGKQVWRGGVLQIPFTCEDVPNGAQFVMASDHILPDSDLIRREIVNDGPVGLLSKYAYFRIYEAVHISAIRPGDTVLYRGLEKTVGNSDIKQAEDGMFTLFGDSFNLGYSLVKRVVFPRYYQGKRLDAGGL